VVPVAAATPVVPDAPADAPPNRGAEHAIGPSIETGEPVRRIIVIQPRAVNRRLVIRNIDDVGLRRLDRDHPPVFLCPDRDLLLLGGFQILLTLRPRAQSLDGVHHVALLCEHRVAQFLRPIELSAHHFKNSPSRRQGFDAVIPFLLGRLGFQLIALEVLVSLHPAFRLDHLQRIGRGHEHFGQKRIRIERDRRNQLLELLGSERLRGRSLVGRLTLRRRGRLRGLILCPRLR
jgi:hypothetical protein